MCVYVSNFVYMCVCVPCAECAEREGVSERASYKEKERARGRANERMSERQAELERRHALSTVY